MKRPKGITAFSVAMAVLSVAGFGNGYAMPELTPYERITAYSYGIAALSTSIGLWKMAQWAGTTFLLWAATTIASALAIPITQRNSWGAFFGFLCFLLLIAYGGRTYIKRRIA